MNCQCTEITREQKITKIYNNCPMCGTRFQFDYIIFPQDKEISEAATCHECQLMFKKNHTVH